LLSYRILLAIFFQYVFVFLARGIAAAYLIGMATLYLGEAILRIGDI
jgi:uncharacterized membrane protein YqaE (UPF0057 family)